MTAVEQAEAFPLSAVAGARTYLQHLPRPASELDPTDAVSRLLQSELDLVGREISKYEIPPPQRI